MKKTFLLLLSASLLLGVSCRKKKPVSEPAQPIVCNDMPFMIISGSDTAILPNAFTPNGDGKNDLMGLVTGVDDDITGQMIIYSGNDAVFTTSNLQAGGLGNGWDGYTATGDTFPRGVYTAKLSLNMGGTTIDTAQCFWLIHLTDEGCVDTTGKKLYFPDQFGNGNIYSTGETICH